MEHIENLLKTALGEIERLLSTKTVVGDPIEVGGNTIVPLVAVGFGFGGGGGSGEQQKSAPAKGMGGGTGGAGGAKPVAVVIVDKAGTARVEAIRGSATVVEKVGRRWCG
ncbi:MAG: spore germination protein GerW family protein [Vicinamibacterales bacterium]